MITTITGFNGKKNQSTYATAVLSAMCSLNKGTKTLVLQLVNKDVESIEYFLTGVEKATVFVEEGLTFTNEGIDGLMRIADNLKLNKEDFDQMCLSLRKENRLDIAEISKSNVFVSNIIPRLDNVNQILKNASEVYDDIFVLLPSNDEEVIKAVNELDIVDRSIYCVKQGYYQKGNIYGNAPLLLVMDYDENSRFTLKILRSSMRLGKNIITRKVNYNIGAKDAAYSNELLGYILSNRDIDEEDLNFIWKKDIVKVLSDILGVNEHYIETDYTFEKALIYAKDLKERQQKSVTDHKVDGNSSTPVEQEAAVVREEADDIVKEAFKHPDITSEEKTDIVLMLHAEDAEIESDAKETQDETETEDSLELMEDASEETVEEKPEKRGFFKKKDRKKKRLNKES